MVAVAILPALAIMGHLAVLLRYFKQSDEFQRALMSKRFVTAACLTMAATTTWGFLELFADARSAPIFLVYPAFWGAYGLVTPFIRSSRP